jgi:hypothetical protein
VIRGCSTPFFLHRYAGGSERNWRLPASGLGGERRAIFTFDWSKASAIETEKIVQRKRDDLMQAELERYMAHAIGHKPKGRLCATTMHEK